MLAPCFANMTACSLHLIPQCAGIHCMITLLCSNMLYIIFIGFDLVDKVKSVVKDVVLFIFTNQSCA